MNHDLELITAAKRFYHQTFNVNGETIEPQPRQLRFYKFHRMALRPVRNPLHEGFWDLFVGPEFRSEIQPNETVEVPTNLLIEIPPGYIGRVFSERDFVGEYLAVEERFISHDETMVPLSINVTNISKEVIILRPYIRFAQLVILPYCYMTEAIELSDTDSFYV